MKKLTKLSIKPYKGKHVIDAYAYTAEPDNTRVSTINNLPDAEKAKIEEAHRNAAYNVAVMTAGGAVAGSAGGGGVQGALIGGTVGCIVGVTTECYTSCHK
jgi:hypothetical protein